MVMYGEPPAAVAQASHPKDLSVLTFDELLAKVGGRPGKFG